MRHFPGSFKKLHNGMHQTVKLTITVIKFYYLKLQPSIICFIYSTQVFLCVQVGKPHSLQTTHGVI